MNYELMVVLWGYIFNRVQLRLDKLNFVFVNFYVICLEVVNIAAERLC